MLEAMPSLVISAYMAPWGVGRTTAGTLTSLMRMTREPVRGLVPSGMNVLIGLMASSAHDRRVMSKRLCVCPGG